MYVYILATSWSKGWTNSNGYPGGRKGQKTDLFFKNQGFFLKFPGQRRVLQVIIDIFKYKYIYEQRSKLYTFNFIDLKIYFTIIEIIYSPFFDQHYRPPKT